MSGQNSISLDRTAYKLGQLLDMSRHHADIVSARCLTAIGVGRYAELTLAADGTWTASAPSGTTTTLAKGGIVLLENVREPSADAFAIGDIIAVCRKGKVVAACESGMSAPTTFGQVANIMHSSTTATNRGKFTTTATATTAGAEIQASSDKDTVSFLRELDSTNGLCAVEINAP